MYISSRLWRKDEKPNQAGFIPLFYSTVHYVPSTVHLVFIMFQTFFQSESRIACKLKPLPRFARASWTCWWCNHCKSISQLRLIPPALQPKLQNMNRLLLLVDCTFRMSCRLLPFKNWLFVQPLLPSRNSICHLGSLNRSFFALNYLQS